MNNNTAVRAVSVAMGFCLLAGVLSARAQTTYVWSAWEPANTDFHTAGHWSPAGGPPGTEDIAEFNAAETHTVNLTSPVTNSRAIVQRLLAATGIDMSFDLGGNTWSLTGTGDSDSTASLVVGRSATATMRVTNGTLAVGSYIIGNSDGSDATLILSGTGTLMTSSAADGILSRLSGSQGTLRIESGAHAELANLRTSLYPTADYTTSGHVVVTGGGSRLQVTALTAIRSPGVDGQSSLLFSAGATGQLDAVSIDEQSSFTIQGNGTTVTNVSTSANSRLNVNGLMVVQNQGAYVHPGTTVTPIRITSTTRNAMLLVESGGSFDAAGEVSVGYFNAESEGTVHVRDGGEFKVGENLRLAGFNAPAENLTGRLWVQNGGRVEVGGYLGLTDSSSSRQAFLEIDGNTSVVKADRAYLGGSETAAFGDAFVTISDQGLLDVTNDTDTGTLRVWGTTELTLDGGAIVADVLDLRAGAALNVALHALQVGGTLIDVTSATATIQGAVLEVSLAAGYTPGSEDVFTLINSGWDGFFKDGSGNDLVDGAVVWGDPTGVHVVLNYVENNDRITLTAIPEPSGLVLLGLAGIMLTKAARRSRAS